MRLATIRESGRTHVVRIVGDVTVDLGPGDVGEVLRRNDWHSWAATQDGPARAVDSLDYAPLIVDPEKIICVGLNYRAHILEGGRPVPTHPTLFAKYTRALIGAHDDIWLPDASQNVDWEAELAVIIGTPARHVSVDDARHHIAGYAVLNDVSMREWQNRTLQWLQGKTWEHATPLGPWLVTADELSLPTSWDISCEVNGEQMQKANTSDLVFGPYELVSYISTVITLMPGDVIATGTPGGVGFARTPPRFLAAGDVVVTRIEGLGECRNVCTAEPRS
jgi:acylpyruvate hydrolase